MPHRLQNPKWPTGSGKVPTSRMTEKKYGVKNRKNEKIMSLIVVTNIVTSRPPKCRLTGTPTACAKSVRGATEWYFYHSLSQPATQPANHQTTFILSMLCSVPTQIDSAKYVRCPPLSVYVFLHHNCSPPSQFTFFSVRCPSLSPSPNVVKCAFATLCSSFDFK